MCPNRRVVACRIGADLPNALVLTDENELPVTNDQVFKLDQTVLVAEKRVPVISPVPFAWEAVKPRKRLGKLGLLDFLLRYSEPRLAPAVPARNERLQSRLQVVGIVGAVEHASRGSLPANVKEAILSAPPVWTGPY